MQNALKSVLKNPALQLALEAVILSFLLYWSFFSWLAFIAFIFAVFYFYFSPSFSWQEYLSSFLILFVSSLALRPLIPAESWWGIAFYAGFFGLFFILLGVKNLVFINRQLLYHFFNNTLFFLVFLVFFLTNKSELFLLKYFLTFFVIFIIFFNWIAFFIIFFSEATIDYSIWICF